MDFEKLVNRHKDAVYRQMVRVCGNHDDAEDVLSEALFAAIKASRQLREPENFQAWLAMIGKRACYRRRVRESLLTRVPLSELEELGFEVRDQQHDTATEVELTELKSCVSGAIELLPDAYRLVYVRREIEGASTEEVAKELRIGLAATKSRLHRARLMVRVALDTGLGCNSTP